MTPARAARHSPQHLDSPAVREQLELYRQIFANSIDGIAIIGIDGSYIEQNAAHRELTGYDDADLVGQTPALHLGRETFARIAGVLSGGKTFRGEVFSRTKSGCVKRVDLSAFPVFNELGQTVCFVGIKRDITERERLQEERAARVRELESVYLLAQALNAALTEEEVYAAALDSLSTVTGANRASILLYDDTGVMRFKAWRGLSESYRNAVEGHSPWPRQAMNPAPIAVADVMRDPSLAAFRDIISAEGIRALAFVPLVHEGRLLGKFMLYFDAPHVFTDGDLRLAQVIGVHIGVAIQRLRTEDALRRSEKLGAAGRLAATVAHEINNPLEAVVNLLFLARHETSNERLQQYLADAEREVARVSEIAKQTLAFYRDTSARSLVNVADVLDATISLYARRLQQRGISVEKCYGAAAPIVFGSAGELRQLFSNVVVNAMDACRPGGIIRVNTSQQEQIVQVEIADNGPGISAENLSHIFEPFFTTKLHLGTGLGLWVAREIAKKHQGTIELATSTDPASHGTRAIVRLPVAAR